MLYIFLVDTGTMMTFDMNLALESVGHLKSAIAIQCQIPEDKQVLLISGGESLDSSSRVCSYSSAGTDTSPIFLFSKNAIESSVPPNCVIDYGPDHDMRERVESCIDMNPNYNTVVARAEMAQQLFEMAKQQLHICERLVHDQHLQQQGWAAVVANLEDIAVSFSNTAYVLEEMFLNFADKTEFVELLQNFNNDLKLLDKIPVLPALLDCNRIDDNQEKIDYISLLEWINQKDTQSSLEQMAEQCSRGLDQIDFESFKKIKEEVKEILESCNNSNMKEVKGLEERLYGLEKLMCEAKKIVDEQRDLAQAFYQNQTRASNLRDPSILPDLCASHQQQLQVMLKNHQQLRDIRRRCSRAKEELSINLHARLRWIMFVEKKLSDIDAKILIYRENLRRVKKHLELVQQIHLAPKIYVTSAVEVVRRKAFSNLFLKWASNLAQQSSDLIDNEIVVRQTFYSQLDAHFLHILFPGMNDFPPRFASVAPALFDVNLPNLSESDIDFLRNELPDLAEYLRLPLPVPMPEPSIEESLKNGIICSQNKEVDKHYAKPCESDIDEYENVNEIDAMPKWQESDANDTAFQPNNDFISGDFLIEGSISSKFKEVFTNTSLTLSEMTDLETKLELCNTEITDKCNALLTIQEDNERHRIELNSTKNLMNNFLNLSSNLIFLFKDFKSNFNAQFKTICSEHLSSITSVKDELINMIIQRESMWSNRQIECNATILKYQKNIQELNSTIQLIQSELNSAQEINKNNENYIEFMSKDLNNKNEEIINIKGEKSETIKQMTLEHELEMVSLKEECERLSKTVQQMNGIINEKTVQFELLKRNNDNLETELHLRFQDEKNSLMEAMNQKFAENQLLIKNEFEEKIRQTERNNEAFMNEMRLQYEEEKIKSLIELKDQLTNSHKNELESLRCRYKLAISTTSIERTPSESSLEKVQLDVIDQLVQEKEVNRLKQLIQDEKDKYEKIIFKLKREKEEEIKTLKSTHQAERQIRFNEAIYKLTSEKDLLMREIRKKDEALQSLAKLIVEKIVKESYQFQNTEFAHVFRQLSDEINFLITNTVNKSSESECDKLISCNCNSGKMLREKEAEYLKLQQSLLELDMARSSSTLGQIDRVAVLSCEVGDIVLIYYEEKFENYIVFSINPVLHFLHTDSVNGLSLIMGIGDARQECRQDARQRWTLAEVTDKEYCQARKQQNRYCVPINTKFYRIKARPWSRVTALMSRSESTTFSASSAFGRTETVTIMDMSSSAIDVDANASTISSQSCLPTKSEDISKN